MRMMVCGCWKKVMGSKAPPAFPAPYACIPSMVRTPVCSSPPPRRCFEGTGCAEPRDAEYPWTCVRCCGCRSTDGWPLLHARSSAQSRLVWFLFWINSAGVLDRSAGGSCGRTSLYYDAASTDFNAHAGGGHENALLRSRLSRSAWGGHTHALGNNARAVMHFTRKRDWNRFHKKIVALCLMSNVSWRKNKCRRINMVIFAMIKTQTACFQT